MCALISGGSEVLIMNGRNTEKRELHAGFSRPVDLTSGTPWRVILRYSFPIIISYFLQQIYVLTDAVICGQMLSVAEVAGINDTYPLTLFFLQFAFGCTAGFSVITARHVGSRDTANVRKSFAVQFALSFAVSALLTLLSVLLLPSLLGMINVNKTNYEVYSAAYDYCFWIFVGIIAQMGYNFVCGVLRAYGDSMTPLVFLIISTVLNVGLDIFFLSALRMGASGAAVATVLAQLISFIAATVYTFVKYGDLRLRRDDFRFSAFDITSHLKQGVPLGLQFSVLSVGIIVMQGAVVKFDLMPSGEMVVGTPAQIGFGAASKMINFLMSAYNGLASGILGYNAQNYGKKDLERIKKGTFQSLIIMLVIFAVCLAVGTAVSVRGAYQYIFLSADKVTKETIRFGNIYLLIDVCLYGVLGFLIVVRSAVQGIFRPMYVLGAGTAELVARTLICSLLPRAVNGAPIDSGASMSAFAAVCFGDPCAWFCASAVLLFPLFRYIFTKKETNIGNNKNNK